MYNLKKSTLGYGNEARFIFRLSACGFKKLCPNTVAHWRYGHRHLSRRTLPIYAYRSFIYYLPELTLNIILCPFVNRRGKNILGFAYLNHLPHQEKRGPIA